MKSKILICLLLFSSSIESIMNARTYREKYSQVLIEYSHNVEDSLKYKAALFLIDNMDGHYSPEGDPIRTFECSLDNINVELGVKELQNAWNESAKVGQITNIPDSSIVTNQMLKANIEDAFNTWNSSSWHSDVDFETFCHYILPYRFSDEHLGGNWRTVLHEIYAPLVINEKNMMRAFAIIKNKVFADIALSNPYCHYSFDAIICRKIGRADCSQRSIFLASVLRSLAIPATIDMIPIWADYSNKSHMWVSVIGKDGTYTVFEDDSIAKVDNPIDGSIFTTKHILNNKFFPYAIKKTKTPIKVYRLGYSNSVTNNFSYPSFTSNPFLQDVSSQYGLKSKVVLDVNIDKDVALCTYLSGNDWVPIVTTKTVNGKAIFDNVGENVVCTVFCKINGKRVYLYPPFYVGKNGIESYFEPDMTNKVDITINRKYPLCQYLIERWGNMKGGVFLGSLSNSFVNADTLAVINNVPLGLETEYVNSNKSYRYFMYKSPENSISSLSELQFWVKDSSEKRKILGNFYAKDVDTKHLEYLNDNNLATYCRSFVPGFSIVMDLGENSFSHIDEIKYSPATDLNFVEKGHLYELYYFYKSWNLLERKVANSSTLTFRNVPSKALLLLKDKTAGTEERIFEYANNEQIWY